MMRVYQFLSSLLITATVMGVQTKAHACSCQIGPREKDFEASAIVFEGQVSEITPRRDASASPGEITKVSLKAVRSWKGLKTEQVTLLTPASASECGFSFQVGKSYLIYAQAAEGSQLTVTSCSRTREISEAASDIEAMGVGSVPVEPKLATEEKKAFSEPRVPRPKPAGCAGCQVGANARLLPPAIGCVWLTVGLLFWYGLRKRGTGL